MRFLHISEFGNSIAKTLIIPYVLEGFLDFCSKSTLKRWKFMCFRQGETHCKNLIIPYVLEGF